MSSKSMLDQIFRNVNWNCRKFQTNFHRQRRRGRWNKFEQKSATLVRKTAKRGNSCSLRLPCHVTTFQTICTTAWLSWKFFDIQPQRKDTQQKMWPIKKTSRNLTYSCLTLKWFKSCLISHCPRENLKVFNYQFDNHKIREYYHVNEKILSK